MNAAVFGEFVGTLVLILLGNGVVGGVLLKKTKAENAGWMVITTGWALAVFAGVAVSISMGDLDAHFESCVYCGICNHDRPSRAALDLYPGANIGGIAGAVLVWLAYLPHWGITEDKGKKLMCFSTIPAIRSYGANFVSEMIGTFVLVLVASALLSRRIAPGGLAGGLGPVLIGAVVWSIGLSLGATTGYAINPARDLGPRSAHAFLPIPGKRDIGLELCKCADSRTGLRRDHCGAVHQVCRDLNCCLP